MTDQTFKPPGLVPSTQAGTIANANTSSITQPKAGVVSVKRSLHDRLRNPVQPTGALQADAMPNRLALLLDCSGSMRGDKIASLRDACTNFVQCCNMADTSLALETFGLDDADTTRLPLTCFAPFLQTTIQTLSACGSTPMDKAMQYVLEHYSLTRCVLVSDGEPDNELRVHELAQLYREAQLPCDCVHIGASARGEACLRRVAEVTGGQYIKFTDIASFSRSFKYLTPAFYGQLTSGSVTAAQLGATEIK